MLDVPAAGLVYDFGILIRVYPQTTSFGPERRFRSLEILDIVHYACGFKIAQTLLRTKISGLWIDTG